MAASSSEKPLFAQTKDLLKCFDLHARKRLGQHFLVNPGILTQIINAAELTPSDLVLEVGPGLGVLTRELARHSGWVIAIELDSQLADLLTQTVADFTNISIIRSDILKIEPLDLIEGKKNSFPPALHQTSNYKLIANLPYYITAPTIRLFCEARLKPQTMVLMVQKEVAQNVVAQPGDLGIFAISVQFYGKPEIVSYVPAGNFYPRPKVDSAILKVNMYSQPLLKVSSEASFFKIVRAGFCAARKQIGNSLSQGLDLPKKNVLAVLEQAGVSPEKRAETLSLEQWALLERTFSEANI